MIGSDRSTLFSQASSTSTEQIHARHNALQSFDLLYIMLHARVTLSLFVEPRKQLRESFLPSHVPFAEPILFQRMLVGVICPGLWQTTKQITHPAAHDQTPVLMIQCRLCIIFKAESRHSLAPQRTSISSSLASYILSTDRNHGSCRPISFSNTPHVHTESTTLAIRWCLTLWTRTRMTPKEEACYQEYFLINPIGLTST